MRAVITFVLLTVVSMGGHASTLDTIVIDSGVDDPIRIAIVPFRITGNLQNESGVNDIVSFDLARSGQFDPVASENMLSHPHNRQQVFFRDWRILNAQYLVIGTVQPAEVGRWDVSFELYDIPNEQQLIVRRYNIALSQWRDVAHRISDAIYEEVTGIRG
ncbi:MAG: Tol-Pal system protein TolB, partial [Pseudomonadales bacterium]|nr:Tol-Pal system protein TolB [Pseudomonadales bacterium]